MIPAPTATGEVIELLRRRRFTLAVAESLTGGLLLAELTSIPGASAVVRGGVIAYATELKTRLLGVDDQRLASHGPVDPDVAVQMARGARLRLGPGSDAASFGLSTTGVAGPGPQDGHSAGTVFVGLDAASGGYSTPFSFAGDRADVRNQTVEAAITILLEHLGRSH